MEKQKREFFVVLDQFGNQVVFGDHVRTFADFNTAYREAAERLKRRPTEKYFLCKAMWVCEAQVKDISICVSSMPPDDDVPF